MRQLLWTQEPCSPRPTISSRSRGRPRATPAENSGNADICSQFEASRVSAGRNLASYLKNIRQVLKQAVGSALVSSNTNILRRNPPAPSETYTAVICAMISKEQFKEDLVATRSKLQALEDQGAARANTLSPELSTIYLTVTAGFLLWISPETVTLAALKSFGLYIGASSFWLCGLEFGERLAISRCRRTVQRPLDAAEGGTLQGQKADVLHGKEFRFLGAVERWLAHGCAVFEPVGWVSDWVADAFFVRVPGLFRGRAA